MVVDNVHHHITVEATPPLHTNYPARTQVQGFIQQLLEDEVTELLGRAKSARRARAIWRPAS